MKLIRKIFIKDYLNVNDPKVREKHGFLASIGGILVNLLLFAFKIAVGILSFSMSIISDAINNLTDFCSCFINLFGFKMAARPADKRHPYGHERIEYIAGMIISFIIISVGIVLGYNAIYKLINKENEVSFSIFAFIVLGVSILVKVLLGLFYYSIGKAISSESLKASMVDSFNDAICTFCVLIAALINHYVDGLWWLDSSISIVVAIFILYSGIKQVCETASPLIGVSLDSQLVKNIKEDMLKNSNILGIHDFICHCYGHTKIYITAHCEVDGNKSIMFIHNEIDKVEDEIKSKYGVELTIHMDPVDDKDEETKLLKKQLASILLNINGALTFHDLHINKEDSITNVHFDILKPNNIKISDEDLKNKIKEEFLKINKDYLLNITIDYKF